MANPNKTVYAARNRKMNLVECVRDFMHKQSAEDYAAGCKMNGYVCKVTMYQRGTRARPDRRFAVHVYKKEN
jgi:hypothetical protein